MKGPISPGYCSELACDGRRFKVLSRGGRFTCVPDEAFLSTVPGKMAQPKIAFPGSFNAQKQIVDSGLRVHVALPSSSSI